MSSGGQALNDPDPAVPVKAGLTWKRNVSRLRVHTKISSPRKRARCTTAT